MQSFIKTIFISIVFYCSNALAATYYVASTGSDSNNGISTSTPFLTINKALLTAIYPGDNILLNRGDTWRTAQFPQFSGNSSSAITISNYGSGDLPKIRGMAIKDSLSFSRVGITNEWSISGESVQPKILYVDNVKWTRGTAGSLAIDEWDWTSASGGTIFVYGDPTGKVVEAGSISHGFYFDTQHHFVIDGVDIGYTNSDSVFLTSTSHDITVKNCNISSNFLYGIFSTSSGSGNIIDNNVMTDFAFQGVLFSDGNSIRISNNEISYAGYSGIKISNADTISVYGNEVSHCATTLAEMINVEGVNVSIYNNYVHDNLEAVSYAGEGIDAFHSNNVEIYGNIIENTNRCGIYSDGSVNVSIHHNLLVNPHDWGISFNDETGGYGNTNGIAYNNVLIGTDSGVKDALVVSDQLLGHYLTGVKYYNNSVYGFRRGAGLTGSGHTGVEYKNNIFDASTEVCVLNFDSANIVLNRNIYHPSTGFLATFNGIDYDNSIYGFEQFKLATGQDVNSIFSDPYYINPLGSDLSVIHGSPATYRAEVLSNDFTTDFNGLIRGSRWSIGAYESSKWTKVINSKLVNVYF